MILRVVGYSTCMDKLLKLEMLGIFFLSVWLWRQVGMDGLGLEWWWYLVWLLVPDVGMTGYWFGTKIGAVTYNLTHHFLVAVTCLLSGAMLGLPIIEIAGIVMLGHSAFDRMLGYGLKYPDCFRHTHLGWLKK